MQKEQKEMEQAEGMEGMEENEEQRGMKEDRAGWRMKGTEGMEGTERAEGDTRIEDVRGLDRAAWLPTWAWEPEPCSQKQPPSTQAFLWSHPCSHPSCTLKWQPFSPLCISKMPLPASSAISLVTVELPSVYNRSSKASRKGLKTGPGPGPRPAQRSGAQLGCLRAWLPQSTSSFQGLSCRTEGDQPPPTGGVLPLCPTVT